MTVAVFMQNLPKLGWMVLTPAENPDFADLYLEKMNVQVN